MKKLFAIAFTLLLTASLSWAQENTAEAGKKVTKTSSPKSKTSAESKVALNPQPLPPGKTKTVSPADKVSLNPQPLPPKERKAGGEQAESKVALNPQPLPPGAKSKTVSPADKVSLNPQPLPPRVTPNAKKKSTDTGKKISAPASSTAKQ